jgi:hypothetical protein
VIASVGKVAVFFAISNFTAVNRAALLAACVAVGDAVRSSNRLTIRRDEVAHRVLHALQGKWLRVLYREKVRTLTAASARGDAS